MYTNPPTAPVPPLPPGCWHAGEWVCATKTASDVHPVRRELPPWVDRKRYAEHLARLSAPVGAMEAA